MIKQLTIWLTLTVITACVPDDKFGLSANKDIKEFEIPGQAGTSQIDQENRTIEIPVDESYDVSSVTPTKITVSNMAHVEPDMGETVDFSSAVAYQVTAEDKSVSSYAVTLIQQSPEVQLPNSNFDMWFDAGGYPEPGDGSSASVWSTANKGLSLVGGYNTEPVSDDGGGFYAKMESIMAPAVVRMAAATLFTGTFTDGFPSVSDPRSNIDFGTPFTAQPTGFTLQYNYQPGPSYEDSQGNVIPGTDECDIYVLLELWIDQGDNTVKQRVGTAWLRSSDVISDWTQLSLDITYGDLGSAAPEYAKPADGYASPGSKPTHITVVFSSSALGDDFTGAIGSILEVDDFVLVY